MTNKAYQLNGFALCRALSLNAIMGGDVAQTSVGISRDGRRRRQTESVFLRASYPLRASHFPFGAHLRPDRIVPLPGVCLASVPTQNTYTCKPRRLHCIFALCLASVLSKKKKRNKHDDCRMNGGGNGTKSQSEKKSIRKNYNKKEKRILIHTYIPIAIDGALASLAFVIHSY